MVLSTVLPPSPPLAQLARLWRARDRSATPVRIVVSHGFLLHYCDQIRALWSQYPTMDCQRRTAVDAEGRAWLFGVPVEARLGVTTPAIQYEESTRFAAAGV